MNASSIRRWVMALQIAVIVMLLGLGFALYEYSRASASLKEAKENRVKVYQLAMEITNNTADLSMMARAYAQTGLVKTRQDYLSVVNIRNGSLPRPENYHHPYWTMINPTNPVKPRPDTTDSTPLLERIKQLGLTEEEQKLVATAVQESQALALVEQEAFNVADGVFKDENGDFTRLGAPNKALAEQMVYSAEYMAGKWRIAQPLGKLYELIEARLQTQVAGALKLERQSFIAMLATLFASLVAIALLMVASGRQQKIALEQSAAAKKLAEDENEALNDSVIMILQAVQQLSERDLTVKAPVTEDVIGTVSDSINALASETARVLYGVTGIADQVAQVSTKVKEQAGLVAQTAQEERAGVQMMVESLLDATQTMNRVAALAEQSNQSADQATQMTDNALHTVNDTVKGMESIRETIAETEKRIKRLGERSQEISGIVNLINTISERTHVLALNASMQAAVAGEAGRGFAVVAEEVQRLAESSRNATQQIATLVGNIQLETNETINTVNQTIGQVVHGSEQAQKAGEQMRRTQEVTAQLVAQVYDIAQASEQQKSMSANLLEAVQRIGDTSEQTAVQIEAQNKEADTLQQAAASLLESVHVFKLPPQTA